MVLSLQFLGNGLAQLHQAEIGSVMDLPLLNGLIGCLLDVLRGVKVRPADLKVEDFLPRPLHGQRFLIDFPDAGGGHAIHTGCNVIVHVCNASFLGVSWIDACTFLCAALSLVLLWLNFKQFRPGL